jgi:predicted nucleic acid-binding protein
VIYIDTSVALAQLLSEDQRPPTALWSNPLVSSRLLEFEMLNVLHARSLAQSHEREARELLARIGILELIPEIVSGARRPVSPTRTLDALHLASAAFLLKQGIELQMATYDGRMATAARKLRIPLWPLPGV